MKGFEIYFYNPEQQWYLDKQCQQVETYQKMFQHGHLTWIVQTFMRLTNFGYACQLASSFPDSGIIFVHPEHLPDDFLPNKNQFIVCVVADRLKHKYAQMHIVQNPNDWILKNPIWGAAYIPHWPQVGIIPRDYKRGNSIENISYFGQESWLSNEFRSKTWTNYLRDKNLKFTIPPPVKWHDYSNTDIVLAIRGFSRNPYYDKPASKLYNSWIAGVPAILGNESAYLAEKRSDLDFLEVSTFKETLNAIEKVQDNKIWTAMVINGKERAKEITYEKITLKWIDTINNNVIPSYLSWLKKSNSEIKTFYGKRRFFGYLYSLRRYIEYNV